MLEHKGIAYRTVELPTGIHPLLIRACGFPGNAGPVRSIDGAHPRLLTMLDRLGTVPAVRAGSNRVQSNRDIARYLDRLQSDPPLLPVDPERRAAVEEAEAWGDHTLQMAARRLALSSSLDDLYMRGADGRLGPLLARPRLLRTVLSRVAGQPFRASPQAERELLSQAPALLDRVDSWIADGRLAGDELNVADFTIAPSLALLSYRRDVAEAIEARPAGAFLDRLLPLPASS
jgi:glutathione S-transferase